MAAAVAKGRQATATLWLFPAAISFVGFFDNIFQFGSTVAGLCREWLEFSRNLWTRLFDELGGFAPVSIDDVSADLLTFWVTCSFAVWLLPMVTRQADGRLMTTVDAVSGVFRAPPVFARPIALVLIFLSMVTIIAPFGAFSQSVVDSRLFGELGQSRLVQAFGLGDWLAGEGVWAAGALVLLAGILYCYNFFVIGPRLADAVLSAAERRDLIVIAVVLWLVSALLLILALFISPYEPSFGFSKADVMVLSLLSLVGLVAWRSALPFVQLVVLVGVIFAIDGVWNFFVSVANAGQGG